MGLVAVVGFTGVFWMAWLVDGARRADVAVVYDSHDQQRAEALVPALQAEGLRVRSVEVPAADMAIEDEQGRHPSAEFRRDLEQSLERTELVIVLDGGGRFGAIGGSPHLREALEVTESQVERNARPRGTVWIWSPWSHDGVTEDSVLEAVAWAKKAPSLLGFDQLDVCSERWPEGRPTRRQRLR